MLIPSSGNGAFSRLSKTHPEPNASCVIHAVSRTLTTNQPSPAGSKPENVSCSCASSVTPLLSSGPVVSLSPLTRGAAAPAPRLRADLLQDRLQQVERRHHVLARERPRTRRAAGRE